jgi:hypothetical protein
MLDTELIDRLAPLVECQVVKSLDTSPMVHKLEIKCLEIANPAKAGDAKLRILASYATPPADDPQDPKTAELPKGARRSCFLI